MTREIPPGRRHERPYDELYERHAAALVRFALRRLGSREEAEDVVAEVFEVAWRRRLDVPADPGPWLFGIARNVVAHRMRGRARRAALVSRLEAERAGAPSADHAGVEDPAARVRAALGRLRPDDREVLLLASWEGLSHAQTATVLGCSTPAVALRLFRARRRLRTLLDETHDESAARPAGAHPIPGGTSS